MMNKKRRITADHPYFKPEQRMKTIGLLGGTEIGMLIQQADTPVKLVDTTVIHAQEAVAYATIS
jgi:aspartate racemase